MIWNGNIEQYTDYISDANGNFWIGLKNMEALTDIAEFGLRIEAQLANASSSWVSEGYSSVKFTGNIITIGPLIYSDSPLKSVMTTFSGRAFRCTCKNPLTYSCWWHSCESLVGVLTANGNIWPHTPKFNGSLLFARMMLAAN